MANLITLSRLPLLLIIILLIYTGNSPLKLLTVPLIILLFLMDWIDGVIARRRKESSKLGSVLDIAIDRIVEATLWIIFADIDIVPVWAPLLVITRDFLVDAIRSYALLAGEAPFEMVHSTLARLLVSSRISRAIYGFIKLFAFSFFAFGISIIPHLERAGYIVWVERLNRFIFLNVIMAVIFCLIRGFPVLFEGRRFLGKNLLK